METAELFRWVLENLNYWVVTVFMAIESSFIPFPSEVVVPPAAWKAMADDSMNIFLVVVFATLGADIGALFNYYLALWLGRPIVYRFANSRIGHMCLIDEEIGPFLLYTTLGAGLWNTVLATIGYCIYQFTDLKTTNDVYVLATKYSHEIGYVLLGLAVFVVAFLIYKARK